MTEVIPFRGIIYDASKVSGDAVVAPPYDIITPQFREKLYSRSPYNIVRVDFGKEFEGDNDYENKYLRASKYFNSWLEDEILIKEKEPAFYAYEVDYEDKGQNKKLRGLLGLVKLVELGEGVYPHECTHSKPKADRLNLMRACNANISPIFSLYNSPEKKTSEIIKKTTASAKPYIQAKDINGSVHSMWPVKDKNEIEIIRDELRGKPIFIADGHHRYETALEFQKEMKGKGGWDYVLMFLANISDDGLTILPTHRLVKDVPQNPLDMISDYFDVERYPVFSNNSDVEKRLSEHKHSIGFFQKGDDQHYILKYKGAGLNGVHPALKGLDVTVLHELIFKNLLRVSEIAYEMDVKATISMVKRGLYDAAFFLNSTKVEDVESVALSGVRMPPKSTYFYPKLLTGLVINSFKYSL